MESFVNMVSLSSIIEKKEKDEGGFTLIEILVVILIIGILAAIAIPVFLNQRGLANDNAAAQDATNVAKAVETYFANNKDATILTTDAVTQIRGMVKPSKGVGTYIYGSANDFCVQSWHVNGKKLKNDNQWADGRPYYLYANKLGGNTLNSGYGGGVSALSCYLDYTESRFNLYNPPL